MLDLKEYGIVTWPDEKITFREKLLNWYDETKEIYPGVEVKSLIISGSQNYAPADSVGGYSYYERFLTGFNSGNGNCA